MASFDQLFKLALLTQGKAHEISLSLLKDSLKQADWSQKGNLIGPLQVGYDMLPATMEAHKLLLVAASDKIIAQNKIIHDQSKKTPQPEDGNKLIGEFFDLALISQGEARDISLSLLKDSLKQADWSLKGNLIGPLQMVYNSIPAGMEAHKLLLVAASDKIIAQNKIMEKKESESKGTVPMIKVMELPEKKVPDVVEQLSMALGEIKEKSGQRGSGKWTDLQKGLIRFMAPDQEDPKLTDVQYEFINKIGKYDGDIVKLVLDIVGGTLMKHEVADDLCVKFFGNSELLEVLNRLLTR